MLEGTPEGEFCHTFCCGILLIRNHPHNRPLGIVVLLGLPSRGGREQETHREQRAEDGQDITTPFYSSAPSEDTRLRSSRDLESSLAARRLRRGTSHRGDKFDLN